MEQIILPNNIFLAQIEKIQIFTIFVRSAPVDIFNFQKLPKIWRKNSIFDKKIASKIVDILLKKQKLPKIVEKHFLWWVEQIILPKNIFSTNW